jgi:hypothetical protein
VPGFPGLRPISAFPSLNAPLQESPKASASGVGLSPQVFSLWSTLCLLTPMVFVQADAVMESCSAEVHSESIASCTSVDPRGIQLSSCPHFTDEGPRHRSLSACSRHERDKPDMPSMGPGTLRGCMGWTCPCSPHHQGLHTARKAVMTVGAEMSGEHCTGSGEGLWRAQP